MLTVHIVRMLSKDVFVEFLSFVEFTHCLIKAGKVIGSSDGNGIVVMLVMFSFSFGPLQRCKEVFLRQRQGPCLKYHWCLCKNTQCPAHAAKLKYNPQYVNSYLGFSKIAQSEVKSSQVVEDLRGHISLHLLLQNAGGCAVRRQRSLNVSLLQDLSQLNPSLHIIWVLLCHLLQMTLGNKKVKRLQKIIIDMS